MVDRLVNSEANAQRITIVENCFGSSGESLAVPGRVLVGEGELRKMCRKKPKPRQFFLFNDIMVYGNIVMKKKKYNKQHIIPLEEVSLETLEDNGVLHNGWIIKTPTKSFAVYAATPAEKTEWMAHINKCVQDLLKRTGKQQCSELAAVWVPDTEANICMHCRRNQFTVLNRRHHCRKCGNVVCGPCSNKKFLLPSQSSKPLRVCTSCYDALSKARCHSIISNSKENLKEYSSSEEDSDEDIDGEFSSPEAKSRKHREILKKLEDLEIIDKALFYKEVTNGDGDKDLPLDNVQDVPITDPSTLSAKTTQGYRSSTGNLI